MVKLTNVQREVLETLVRLYEEKNRRMVKSREVAEVLGKDEGTVRNVIMWLKSMGLVTSRTGPAGGYAPTLKAYEIVKGSPGAMGLSYGKLKVKEPEVEGDFVITSMEILGLFSLENAKALIRLASGADRLGEGYKVRVESAPVTRMVVEGTVEKVEPRRGEVLVSIEKFIVIPEARVGEIASRRLVTLREDMSVREAARVLYTHGIRGAPVVGRDGNVVGFLTTTDIAVLVAFGKDLEAPVSSYMRRSVFTINESESIVEAMRIMDYYGVGRLLVIDSRGKPVGIITRTDILRYLVALD